MTEPDPILARLAARMGGSLDDSLADLCGAADVERGKPVAGALQQRAVESPSRVRIVRRGRPMTMDLRPDRLTIIVDDDGIVVSARCG